MTNTYQLNNIKVDYGDHIALDIAELIIPSEQRIAILGDNGAGKSSLLHLLAGLSHTHTGSITLLDKPMRSPLSKTQRRSIAFVSQHPYLLTGTVHDNLKLALSLQGIPSSRHATLIASALALTHTRHIMNQAAHTLSGGELKRVAIARAIVYQPSVLLLDEPFSHLDQHQIKSIENLILTFAKQSNTTIIFSNHNRLQSHALADNTINLVAGKLTTSPLINLFHGRLHNQLFITPTLKIHTNSAQQHAQHIAIDPLDIIISTQPLESSMRNHFSGRIILIADDGLAIRLLIDCGEQFHVTISPESLNNLNFSLGKSVFLSFKSTAVTVF